MITARSLSDVPASVRARAVTIGKFDGVHVGHQEIIAQLKQATTVRQLDTVVVTFDRNPLALLRPELCPEALIDSAQKIGLLERQGVDLVLELAFTEALAELSPREFVMSVLRDGLNARLVLVGEDFRFGHRGAGTVESLIDLAAEFDCEIVVVPAVTGSDDRVVSSTVIRRLMEQGDVRAAAKYLGRNPAVSGEVVHGAARGRELGFPTANLSIDSSGFIPADGVYAGWLVDGDSRLPAAISVGSNPTFEGVPAQQVEAHVIDAELDLYGHVVAVEFAERIRGMVAYNGIEPLIAQIAEDVNRCRAILEAEPR